MLEAGLGAGGRSGARGSDGSKGRGSVAPPMRAEYRKLLKELEADSVDTDILDDELRSLEAIEPQNCRGRTNSFLNSSAVHLAICVLIMLDAAIVIAEILLDLHAMRSQYMVVSTDVIQLVGYLKENYDMENFSHEEVDKIIKHLRSRQQNMTSSTVIPCPYDVVITSQDNADYLTLLRSLVEATALDIEEFSNGKRVALEYNRTSDAIAGSIFNPSTQAIFTQSSSSSSSSSSYSSSLSSAISSPSPFPLLLSDSLFLDSSSDYESNKQSSSKSFLSPLNEEEDTSFSNSGEIFSSITNMGWTHIPTDFETAKAKDSVLTSEFYSENTKRGENSEISHGPEIPPESKEHNFREATVLAKLDYPLEEDFSEQATGRFNPLDWNFPNVRNFLLNPQVRYLWSCDNLIRNLDAKPDENFDTVNNLNESVAFNSRKYKNKEQRKQQASLNQGQPGQQAAYNITMHGTENISRSMDYKLPVYLEPVSISCLSNISNLAEVDSIRKALVAVLQRLNYAPINRDKIRASQLKRNPGDGRGERKDSPPGAVTGSNKAGGGDGLAVNPEGKGEREREGEGEGLMTEKSSDMTIKAVNLSEMNSGNKIESFNESSSDVADFLVENNRSGTSAVSNTYSNYGLLGRVLEAHDEDKYPGGGSDFKISDVPVTRNRNNVGKDLHENVEFDTSKQKTEEISQLDKDNNFLEMVDGEFWENTTEKFDEAVWKEVGKHERQIYAKNLKAAAHILHYISIVILGIFVLQVFVKIYAMGSEFFKNKMEVFDGIITVASFALDLAFVEGVTVVQGEEAIALLILFLLWRILRLVNGLLVAAKQRQEFRIKLQKRGRMRSERRVTVLELELGRREKEIENLVRLCMEKSICRDEILACRPKQSFRHLSASTGLSSIATFSLGLSMSMRGNGGGLVTCEEHFSPSNISHSPSPATRRPSHSAFISTPSSLSLISHETGSPSRTQPTPQPRSIISSTNLRNKQFQDLFPAFPAPESRPGRTTSKGVAGSLRKFRRNNSDESPSSRHTSGAAVAAASAAAAAIANARSEKGSRGLMLSPSLHSIQDEDPERIRGTLEKLPSFSFDYSDDGSPSVELSAALLETDYTGSEITRFSSLDTDYGTSLPMIVESPTDGPSEHFNFNDNPYRPHSRRLMSFSGPYMPWKKGPVLGRSVAAKENIELGAKRKRHSLPNANLFSSQQQAVLYDMYDGENDIVLPSQIFNKKNPKIVVGVAEDIYKGKGLKNSCSEAANKFLSSDPLPRYQPQKPQICARQVIGTKDCFESQIPVPFSNLSHFDLHTKNPVYQGNSIEFADDSSEVNMKNTSDFLLENELTAKENGRDNVHSIGIGKSSRRFPNLSKSRAFDSLSSARSDSSDLQDESSLLCQTSLSSVLNSAAAAPLVDPLSYESHTTTSLAPLLHKQILPSACNENADIVAGRNKEETSREKPSVNVKNFPISQNDSLNVLSPGDIADITSVPVNSSDRNAYYNKHNYYPKPPNLQRNPDATAEKEFKLNHNIEFSGDYNLNNDHQRANRADDRNIGLQCPVDGQLASYDKFIREFGQPVDKGKVPNEKIHTVSECVPREVDYISDKRNAVHKMPPEVDETNSPDAVVLENKYPYNLRSSKFNDTPNNVGYLTDNLTKQIPDGSKSGKNSDSKATNSATKSEENARITSKRNPSDREGCANNINSKLARKKWKLIRQHVIK